MQQSSAQAAAPAQLAPTCDFEQPHGQLPKLPAVVQLISENYFSHRKRKVQDEDDIMVCHCPPPWRGGDGCGPNCINRMLCIECTEVGEMLVAWFVLSQALLHGVALSQGTWTREAVVSNHCTDFQSHRLVWSA